MKNIVNFLKAIKYISSLDALEYETLKRCAKKEKNYFFMILSNIIVIGVIILLFYKLFLISFILVIILVIFAFFAYYSKLYNVLKNQIDSPFFKNKKS